MAVLSGPGGQIVRSVATRLSCTALGAVAGMVTARALLPAGRGEFAVVMTLAAVTQSLGHLSVEQSQMALWRTGKAVIPSNAVLLGPAAGLCAAFVSAVVVTGLGPGIVPLPGFWLAAVALASVPFGMTVLYLNNVLVLQARVGVVNRSLLITMTLQVAVLLTAAATGHLTVLFAVAVWSVSVGFPLVVLLPAIRPRFAGRDLAFARRTVLHGVRYHGGFAAMFLLLRLDVLILNGMSTPAAVGLYALAVTVAEMSRILTDATAQVALSRQADSELADAAAVTLRAARLSALLAVAAVGGMCLLAPVAIPLMYGHAFAASVSALFALAPGMIALGATRPLGAYLLRLDRPLWTTTITVTGVAVNVVGCLVLIPVWGIVGCASASSLGYLAVAVWQLVWFLRSTGAAPSALLPGSDEFGWLRRRPVARSGAGS
jgi:O-antigen/teichoic acid export membrane protein